MTSPICPYCQAESHRTTGKVVYPRHPRLADKVIYRCVPCDAYVGCHPGTDKPLGRLANAELRQWKKQAHAAFDILWQSRIIENRSKAYAWLAQEMGIREIHIGEQDIEGCKRVIELSIQRHRDSLKSPHGISG